jgi:hypothetical protein
MHKTHIDTPGGQKEKGIDRFLDRRGQLIAELIVLKKRVTRKIGSNFV